MKNSAFLILLSLLFFSTTYAQQQVTNCESLSEDIAYNQPLTWHDLNPEERKEAISHFLETGDCEYKGIKLYGKVQFVESFPDIKIQYVTSFPDIKVKFVTSFPDDCGEWQKVTSFPDFKVQVVTSFPDLKVQEVDSFPGMR